MERFGTLESPFDPEYLRWCVQEAGFVDARQFMEVDRLVALDDTSGALGLLTGWIRARRGRPQTNTLIAAKPMADLGGGDAWRGLVSVAGPAAAAPGGATRVPLRIQNTGRAFGQPQPATRTRRAPSTSRLFCSTVRERVELPRIELPHSLPGGGEILIDLVVPWEYRDRGEILVGLVREGMAWFPEDGSPPARLQLD